MIESLLHKEESSLIFSAKKLICIGEKSVPQTACLSSKVNKCTAELSFGSLRNPLSRSAQISTEIGSRRRSFSISLNFHRAILELSPQTRFMFDIKKLLFINARRSFSISLNFHRAILELSPQTRFMFDIKKLLFINALIFIPFEFPKHGGHITDYSKAKSTVLPATLRYSTSSVCYCFALLCFITT